MSAEAPGPAPDAALPAAAAKPAGERVVTGDELAVAKALNPALPRPGAPFEFTGSGPEYFRIWVVNTLLTLLTLGIYSAWAKVRKTAYFARNTRLLGDSFEFVADPWAILRGRVLALVLFGFYSFAFDFSLAAGLFAVFCLLALAPALFVSAMRFRLQNTRWRAIRFGFHASSRDAYGRILIVVAVWVSGTVAGALGGETSLFVAAGVALLLLPWMHHRLKAFQHGHASFAGLPAQFTPALGAFYVTYLVSFLLLFGAAVIGGIGAAVSAAVFAKSGLARNAGIAVGVIAAVVVYVSAWPYFAARIQRTVWTRTRIGPHAFATTISFATLWPVAAKNAALIAITAGLYWPFAAIAWARYRVGCMSIVPDGSLDAAVVSLDPGAQRGALGEGAFDFFGIDVGW